MVAMLLVAYSVSSATAFLVDGQLQRLFSRRKAMKKISHLSGHYIVCGSGVTGDVILDELVASGHWVVVVDEDPDSLADMIGHGRVIPLEGDATDDETLREAGIERAAGLVAALPNDKDNLFLIVSAKQLCPSLRVGSLASDQHLHGKLVRAGADAVVAGSYIGGLRLASEMIRPAVVSFLDKMLRQDDSPVRFAQVQVGAAWAGRTIAALDPFNTEGLPVLAVKGKDSDAFKFNPRGDQVLEEGMDIVTMGETERVVELMRRVGDTSAPTIIAPEEPPASGKLSRKALGLGDTPGTLGREEGADGE
jgi:voltage-gated potassium channel